MVCADEDEEGGRDLAKASRHAKLRGRSLVIWRVATGVVTSKGDPGGQEGGAKCKR
jgi:hypothetical protein